MTHAAEGVAGWFEPTADDLAPRHAAPEPEGEWPPPDYAPSPPPVYERPPAGPENPAPGLTVVEELPPARNVDGDGQVHALTVDPDGRETCLCGQEGCEKVPRLYVAPEPASESPGPEDVIQVATACRLPWHVVADQYGVERTRVQDWIDLQP